MKQLAYLNLSTTDPDFNLAAEEYVFDALPRNRNYCMLWQNDRAIIIGKHQNTLAEINQPYVEQNGIRVVRRLSGGGAVYHDLGNLNFTFIADAQNAEEINFSLFCQPVLRTLEALGVNAQVNGRNDMTIDGKKFSGNSQYLRDGRVMHHGTILFDSDLQVVSQALQVDPEKIRAKGIQSVRSRVTNVRPCLPRDITLAQFRQLLLQEILRQNGGEDYRFNEEDLAAIEERRSRRYGTWQWNYGESLVCTLVKRRRFEGCGTVEAYLDVEQGVIRSVAFRGDFFSPRDPEELARCLVGLRPERQEYEQALQIAEAGRYFVGLNNEQLLELLCEG